MQAAEPRPIELISSAEWERARWAWKRAVRRDPRLSDAAKVLAAALVDDFANARTGFCNPAVATLAEALAKSERTVQRARAELRAVGWIVLGDETGRGNAAVIQFAKGDSEVELEADERVTRLSAFSAERVTSVVGKGDKSVVPPCTPYKEQPRSNHGARATGPVGEETRPAPQCRQLIRPGSHNEEAWDRHLAGRQMPTLRALGLVVEAAGEKGWEAPFALPPQPEDLVGMMITDKWLRWALQRLGDPMQRTG